MTVNVRGSPKMEGAVREVLGGASEELDGLVVGNDIGLGDNSSSSTSTSFSTFSSIHLSTSSSPHSSSQST